MQNINTIVHTFCLRRFALLAAVFASSSAFFLSNTSCTRHIPLVTTHTTRTTPTTHMPSPEIASSSPQMQLLPPFSVVALILSALQTYTGQMSLSLHQHYFPSDCIHYQELLLLFAAVLYRVHPPEEKIHVILVYWTLSDIYKRTSFCLFSASSGVTRARTSSISLAEVLSLYG